MSTHEATTQQPLLQAIDLKKHYPVKKGLFAPERLVKALDGVSFNLERGKTLAVVGESGCGKSTLGRLLTMIETPTGGELYYQGQDLLKHDPQTMHMPIQVISGADKLGSALNLVELPAHPISRCRREMQPLARWRLMFSQRPGMQTALSITY